MHTADYCREIETYLCRKNDGHLIRVVGPSFELVSQWAARGVPLKVAFSGIDKCFERYYRKGPRRRPIKIDFCEADVLEAFDAWRRAIGLPVALEGSITTEGAAQLEEGAPAASPSLSLPAHLERVVARLTNARVSEALDEAFDAIIDAAAQELDAARASARGVRGEARHALIARLAALDDALLDRARAALDEPARIRLLDDADAEVAPFRDRMAADAYARIRGAAFDRLLRERLGLPVLRFG